MRLAIIADDLTGAADAAAPFAARGFRTVVAFGDGPPPAADIVALSTGSRELPAAEAAARVHTAAARLASADDYRAALTIFKKIDSTLRGQIGPEIDAVMDAPGRDRALVAPAFPAQGRTTRDARQLLQGIPLERSEFASAITTSDLAELIASVVRRPVHRLSLNIVRGESAQLHAALALTGVTVADAESDADLIALARAADVSGIGLLCGSAGLAHALAETWGTATSSRRQDRPRLPGGPILVVAASRHPQTQRQIDRLAANGATVVAPSARELVRTGGAHEDMAAALTNGLLRGDHVVLTVGGDFEPSSDGRAMAESLGLITRMAIQRVPLGGLVLTGGDAAAAVCEALGTVSLHLQGEVEPGISWGMSRGGMLNQTPVVMKAGGFGHHDSLRIAVEHLIRVSSEV